jgi:hypothetical protein
MEEAHERSKRLSYMAKLRCEVFWYAKKKGNHRAAAVFGVDEGNV